MSPSWGARTEYLNPQQGRNPALKDTFVTESEQHYIKGPIYPPSPMTLTILTPIMIMIVVTSALTDTVGGNPITYL